MNKLSNLSTLIKFNLKYYLKPRFATKKDKRRYYITMGIVAAALLIPIISFIVGIYMLITTVQDVELSKGLLTVLFALSQVATLIFGITTYLQVMYLSKDKDILATLPVTSTEVFISKIITVTAMEMVVSTVILLPTTIVTAIALGQIGVTLPIWYFVLIPVAIITLPLLVILLISFFAFPIMKMYSFLKKHQTIGAIIVVLLIVGILMAIYIPLYSNMGSSSTPNIKLDEEGNEVPMTDEEIAEQSRAATQQSMANIAEFGKYMYHAKVLVDAMFGINVGINLLIYFGITLGALALGIGLSILLYQSTLQSLDENATTSSLAQKEYVESSITKALVKRELSVIGRDISKLINALMAYVMGPAMVFVMLFIMNMNKSGADGDSLYIMNAFNFGFAFAFAVMMIGASNIAASAGFSLEGKSFAILKTMPVRGRDIFKAKLMVVDIGALISSALVLIISVIFTKVNVIDIIGFIVCITITVPSVNAYSLHRDLKHPKLEWTIIKEITKNNVGTLVPLLITMPLFLGSISIPIVLSIFIKNSYIVSGIQWGVMLVASLIYYFTMRFKVLDKVDPLFEQVEC